ncbi:response regulator [bacterium]|nr:response regulator [bacterium]
MSPRILAIDDTEHLRTVIRLTLEYKKYEVKLAADGVEGLEAARAGAFDLIICDIEMPRMGGVEFVTQYRAEFGPATPIIMLTAEGDEKIKAARAAGATDALAKPFEPMQLFAAIDRHLKERV